MKTFKNIFEWEVMFVHSERRGAKYVIGQYLLKYAVGEPRE